MKRTLHTLAFPLGCAAALFTSSCVPNDQSLVLEAFLFVDPMQMCIVSMSSMATINAGKIDATLAATFNTGGYKAAALVRNDLIANGTTTTAERNNVTINGFEVDLQPQKGFTLPSIDPSVPHPYTVASAAGTVGPNGGRVVGIAEILSAASLASLASQLGAPGWNNVVVAKVRALGTRGGDTLRSGYLEFPITICNGCLGNFDQMCPTGGYDTNSVLMGGCYVQQDAPVTCCVKGAARLCGKAVPMATGGGTSGGGGVTDGGP
jgi:hypothetical protein